MPCTTAGLFFCTILLYNYCMFILVLFALSVLASLFSYPLWLFATNFQGAYTIAVSLLSLSVIFFFCARHFKKSTISVFLKIAVVFAGIFAFFSLVLHGKRLFAIPAILVAAVLYLFVSHFFASAKTELSADEA